MKMEVVKAGFTGKLVLLDSACLGGKTNKFSRKKLTFSALPWNMPQYPYFLIV
jgi:hypothetical protein